ncbi:class I SAM-dependent methyltransferase [Lapillicoccus jejuensis]|uniref:Ubiquinone/menaquinone biosynthesis C-methylase UbiE n=1 Tax=Lapillicoccus jejuensis TaxID=402171 RepID=A0A542DZW9_9MICO|nr:class I SAM-dependent methyltransferase [Lapillicoccus jejuensis]TQJ08596.1 ubiquinone/menaquinone biosynthesis C-methylase UbiE [Lapillicoccus jejuensis]
MEQPELDARLQAYYTDEFVEAERLTTRSAQGRLELERVQEVVRGLIPAGSRVVDVGGATGVHAAALAAAGYDVVLVDPVPAQVAQAARVGTFRAVVGDARRLEVEDDWADAALLLGPLYHLASRADRLTALREAARVVRPGGWVVAAAIPRLARLTSMLTARGLPPVSTHEWTALLERGDPTAFGRFPGGHFHTAQELADELTDAGLDDVEVFAVEGPDGFAFEQLAEVDEEAHQAASLLARRFGHLPRVRDLSPHVLAVGRVRE